MIDVLNLALPFFGLIALGYAAGKFADLPDGGLAWMNFFLIYVALPCLFDRVLARSVAAPAAALIFCIDSVLSFALVPLPVATRT